MEINIIKKIIIKCLIVVLSLILMPYTFFILCFMLLPYWFLFIFSQIATNLSSEFQGMNNGKYIYYFLQFPIFIHEFSHLLTSILFGHHITGVKLFTINKKNRVNYKNENGEIIGYVNGYVHGKYKNNSIYQCTGLFFIGIAPILGGISTIVLTMMLTCHIRFEQIVDLIKNISVNDGLGLNPIKATNFIITFCYNSFCNTEFFYKVIFILLVFFISLGCFSLSPEDVQTIKLGIKPLALLLFPIFLYIQLQFGSHLIATIIALAMTFWLFIILVLISSFFLDFCLITLLKIYILAKIKLHFFLLSIKISKFGHFLKDVKEDGLSFAIWMLKNH